MQKNAYLLHYVHMHLICQQFNEERPKIYRIKVQKEFENKKYRLKEKDNKEFETIPKE